jgi:hypothetical protein
MEEMEEMKEIMCQIIDMNSLESPLLYSIDLTFYIDHGAILSIWIKEKSTNKLHLIQNWSNINILEEVKDLTKTLCAEKEEIHESIW